MFALNSFLTSLFLARHLFLGLALFGTLTPSLSAQDSEKILSIKQEANQSHDTIKVMRYSDLCYEYRFISQDSSIKYGQKAIDLGRKINYKKGEAQGNNDLGIIYSDRNEFGKALGLYQTALKIRIEINDSLGQASLFNKLGIIYQKQGELSEAMDYQLQALRFYERLNHKYGAAQCLNNVAIIYYNQGQLDDALDYYNQSYAIKKEIGDKYGMAGTLANIGNIYYSNLQFDSAIIKTNEAVDYLRQLGANEYLAAGLNNLGAMQQEAGQLEAAKKSILESLAIREEQNDPKGIASCKTNLASLSIRLNELKQAEKYLSEALVLASTHHLLLEMRQIYTGFADLYTKQKKFEMATVYYEKLVEVKDSIFSEESNKQILELKTQYETEKKEQEIELLSVENQLKETEIQIANNRLMAAIGASGLLLATIFLLFNRYKHKQRALLAEEKAINQKLGFKSLIEGEEKERKRIAQELHDGLGQLLSTARLNISALEDMVKTEVDKQWQNSIKLIDEAVTEVRHISHNMMPNALVSIGFEAALKEQVHIINDAGKVKVHAELPAEKIPLPESEAIALYRVIQEVLNNALKYAEAKNIWLTISHDLALSISIKDDGKGFDTNVINTSDGIGWQNIYSRMEILNGEVHIHSNPGHGSEISLKLAV